ncbi:hypothetical protein FAUST_6489 [Fusarium austroamericanum]|uniref:Cytochrome P450 n=1 Tax=Fusarium austroamericanum TaxID=282268 RepID=A0AAN6BZ30_FUSAU|nr:hypothetical protein FAUST_6489 [Fusarium austroamericanum]
MSASEFKAPGLLVTISLLIVVLYRGYRARRFYRDLPGPPHSWLLGHISILKSIAMTMPPNSMPQLYYTEIAHRYNLEDIFYLDLWPIGPSLVIITDPILIEQDHIPRPMVPHPFTNKFMAPIAGVDIIPTKSGTEWKKLRNDMSPAFSRAHTHNMVGVMVNESKLLRGKLDEFLATGQVFSMEELLNKTIFGIVSRHLLNDESYAQKAGRQDLADMRELIDLAREESDPRIAYNPLVQIPRRMKRYIVRRKLDASLLSVIYKRLETLVSGGIVPSKQNPTSVLDLILREHVELAIRENKEGHCNYVNLSKVEEKQLLT